MQTFRQFLTENREDDKKRALELIRAMNKDVFDTFMKQKGGKFPDMDAAIKANDEVEARHGFRKTKTGVTIGGIHLDTKDLALGKVKPKHGYGK